MASIKGKQSFTHPMWLNKELFDEVLKRSENTYAVKLIDYDVQFATDKGDNYSSIVLRVTVTYNRLDDPHPLMKKQFIIKKMLEQDSTGNETYHIDKILFETESKIYTDIIPKFEEVLQKCNNNSSDRLAPKTISLSANLKDVIIFEDLKESGYSMIKDRLLTFEEAKLTFIKIAKFHALSFKLHNEGDRQFSEFTNDRFKIRYSFDEDLFFHGFDILIEFLSTANNPKNNVYIEKLSTIKKPILEKIFNENAVWHENTNWYVLTHGDIHMGNLMFKIDDKTQSACDVQMIDFQTCKFTHAAFDIINSLYFICDRETRVNHRDEIIYVYYTEFVETLNRTGYKGNYPSLHQLQKDLLDWRYFEVFLIATLLPHVDASTEDKTNSDISLSPTDDKLKCYNTSAYRKDIEDLLSKLLHKGYLDDY